MLNTQTSKTSLSHLITLSFDKAYHYSLNGCLGFSSAYELAEYYQSLYTHPDKAIDEMIKCECFKISSSGFLTNLGGIFTLPLTLPLNTLGLLLFQMRLILTIAIIYKIEVTESKVKPYFYLLLCGQSGKTLAQNYLKTHFLGTSTSLTTMTYFQLGKLFLLQVGAKNAGKLLKVLPVVSGLIGGVIDYGMTYNIAHYAKKQLYQVIEQ